MYPERIILEDFMQEYERMVVPAMDEAICSFDEFAPLSVYQNGTVREQYIPIQAPTEPDLPDAEEPHPPAPRSRWNTRDLIVYNGRIGKVVGVTPDAEHIYVYDIEYGTIPIPPSPDEICQNDQCSFHPVKQFIDFQRVRRPFHVINRIADRLSIGPHVCGLQLIESTRTDNNTWIKEGRLGMAHITNDGIHDQISLTQESGRLLQSYCRSQTGIVRTLEQQGRLTIENAFPGNPDAVVPLKRWIDDQVKPNERPVTTDTLSSAAIKEIGRLAQTNTPVRDKQRGRVRESGLVRSMQPPEQYFLGQCYLCVDRQSPGVGILVGYSTHTRRAAVVQTQPSVSTTTFGGFLDDPIGIITTLDSLVLITAI
jgi:hypothetical protein